MLNDSIKESWEFALTSFSNLVDTFEVPDVTGVTTEGWKQIVRCHSSSQLLLEARKLTFDRRTFDADRIASCATSYARLELL